MEREALEWYNVSQAPPYVPQLVSRAAVETVMHGVRCVLEQLDLKPASINTVPVAEFASYWAELLRELYAQVTIWAPANLAQYTELLIHRIAAGVYSMFWEQLRYRHFLVNGAPAGVAELPLYVNMDGQKTYAVNNAWWSVPGKSWAHYRSCTASEPRRKQNLRSSPCSPNDIFDPRAFA